jgi:hypothetical protein
LVILAVAPFLSFAIANLGWATSSENVCYRSKTATICFGWNGGGEYVCSSVFSFASARMPLFLGLEREAARRGRHFEVQYGQFPKKVVIDGRPLDVADTSESTELADALSQALGCEARPVSIVPAFSIQLELLPTGSEVSARMKEWSERLSYRGSDLGLISHEGDCDLSPLWSHVYKDGRTGVRYGLFATFSGAWRDAAALGFDRGLLQIVRTKLRADSLHVYFGPRS